VQSVAGSGGHDAGGPAPDLARRRRSPRHRAEPGTLVTSGPGALCIATGEGLLLPVQVQPENRKAMAWEDFLRGSRMAPGARITEISA
jgi:methionyl-tRNA formyltransferase